jgi:serine/threonine protein kinase
MDSADEIELLDELLDRVLRGDRVQLDEFLKEYPDLGEAGRSRVHKVARTLGIISEDAAQQAHSDLPFEHLGPFRLIERLGEGGMGVVYRAEQQPLGREVALKVIRTLLQSSSVAGQRFQREAQAVAKLRHPNVVTVHAAGEEDGVAYLAMELVHGQGLDEILQSKAEIGERLAIPEAIRHVRDVARALQCAHEEDIIHRDVKPSNIRVTPEGQALLLDFGLARGADLHAVSRDDRFRGTAHYASPEQVEARQQVLDARTDLYSLGVTLYECATGQVPFRGETTEQVFHQILARNPRGPRHLNSAISRDLEAVISTAMETDRERRYATAQALAASVPRPSGRSPGTGRVAIGRWQRPWHSPP